MATIDLIVLGILKTEPLSAYDIQKLVEYRNISKWVKISTPSIYKKVITLEDKGLIKKTLVKEGKMPEKAVYSLTAEGEKEFKNLMVLTSLQPIRIFLDLNAVIVNLDSLSAQEQKVCLDNIEKNLKMLKTSLEENQNMKASLPEISQTGKAVLNQQVILAEAIENWLEDTRKNLNE
ncbi:helix-turn-helix transcriptional regulator [Enterococcus alishanensis]